MTPLTRRPARRPQEGSSWLCVSFPPPSPASPPPSYLFAPAQGRAPGGPPLCHCATVPRGWNLRPLQACLVFRAHSRCSASAVWLTRSCRAGATHPCHVILAPRLCAYLPVPAPQECGRPKGERGGGLGCCGNHPGFLLQLWGERSPRHGVIPTAAVSPYSHELWSLRIVVRRSWL